MKTDTPSRLTRRMINGLILLVPIAITVFVISETLDFTEGVLGRHLPFYFPGLGILTLLGVIYITGWLSSYWFMRRVIRWAEGIVGKIPIVKFIYNSVKHLSTAVFESNSMFEHVVLVPFHQSKAIGFLMADVPPALQEKLGDDYVCVFVPWSLNMTSGTNLFVKKSDVIYLDISSESALQYMLTAGAVMPKRLDHETSGSAMERSAECLALCKEDRVAEALQGTTKDADGEATAKKSAGETD
ncbi:DUF502 domain-containing protein [uncultured Selenomonas sp.]|uniref:DUF502 domain-containing protein n=1 Tax=uncultured Selenomonas sp. TaxID=159275 RepID=UPI0025D16D75|nr:DUF502 domain-containing protein [uncultured Selenomonas sp.]